MKPLYFIFITAKSSSQFRQSMNKEVVSGKTIAHGLSLSIETNTQKIKTVQWHEYSRWCIIVMRYEYGRESQTVVLEDWLSLHSLSFSARFRDVSPLFSLHLYWLWLFDYFTEREDTPRIGNDRDSTIVMKLSFQNIRSSWKWVIVEHWVLVLTNTRN